MIIVHSFNYGISEDTGKPVIQIHNCEIDIEKLMDIKTTYGETQMYATLGQKLYEQTKEMK